MKVRFVVNPRGVKSSDPGEKLLALERSDWDDYGFGTTFTLYVVEGEIFDFVGNLKIAEHGQSSNGAYTETVHTKLDSEFTRLREDQFSVAQDATYYRNLIDKVGSPLALKIAERLNDLASMEHIPDRIIEERVTQRSLLRYVSLRTVMDQYRDLLHGRTLPQPFSLTYHFDSPSTGRKEMVFEVKPGSVLPTNLHVIIGPNGMGKTRTLRRIASALDERDPEHDPSALAIADRRKFAGLVSVSFSAFDIFPERNRLARSQAEFRVTRVGLPIKFEEDEESLDIDAVLSMESNEPRERAPQTAAEMQSEYWEKLVEGCLADRPEPLMAALSLLADADQVLANAGVADSKALMSLDFAGLSSGHKIVLLTMCSLVRYCEARTLVLVDEPESHLHPPLLGAFSRALSDLMSTTNGLAIVATHSPVVLQEVPSSCAWKIWSLEGIGTIKRPELQTFGENLGVLTEEVFGLELDKSGYHALLRDIASRFEDYASAKDHLDGRLGQEAKVLLRTMIEMNFQK